MPTPSLMSPRLSGQRAALSTLSMVPGKLASAMLLTLLALGCGRTDMFMAEQAEIDAGGGGNAGGKIDAGKPTSSSGGGVIGTSSTTFSSSLPYGGTPGSGGAVSSGGYQSQGGWSVTSSGGFSSGGRVSFTSSTSGGRVGGTSTSSRSAGAIGGNSSRGGTMSSASSGGVPAACKDVQACGGSVVGTWNVTGSCLEVKGQYDISALGLGCRSVGISGSLQVKGTWIARSDGTYVDNTYTWGREQFSVPASCLRIAGTSIGCAPLGPIMAALGYLSPSCSDATGGGCTCDATIDQKGSMGVISSAPSPSGSYRTTGNTLVLDGNDRHPYCTSGNVLTIVPRTTDYTTTGWIALERPSGLY